MTTKNGDKRDKTIGARAHLASLICCLASHAALTDPADIADAASDLIDGIAEDLKVLLGHFGARDVACDQEHDLRDLLLAGDTMLVDFRTEQGPGRLALNMDPETPVTFTGSSGNSQSWQELWV